MPTPPPYASITGIYTTDDKHQAISKADYDGSAKPGQLVVDTTDYSVWVGDDTGALNPVGSGGTSTKIQNGTSKVEISTSGGEPVVTVGGDEILRFTVNGISFEGGLLNIFKDGGDLEIINTDDDILIDSRNGGDDIWLYSGDFIRIYGGDKDLNLESEGGGINIQAGDGSSSDDGISNAANGGDLTLSAGSAGTAVAPASGNSGGTVYITAGNSSSNGTAGTIEMNTGSDPLGVLGLYYFGYRNGSGTKALAYNENIAALRFQPVTLSELGSATTAGAGSRAFILDSNVPASGNFGEIAVTGGGNTVPVYSDGVNWRIG
jgi:hypothetical protein